jgi:hypothetical protein
MWMLSFRPLVRQFASLSSMVMSVDEVVVLTMLEVASVASTVSARPQECLGFAVLLVITTCATLVFNIKRSYINCWGDSSFSKTNGSCSFSRWASDLNYNAEGEGETGSYDVPFRDSEDLDRGQEGQNIISQVPNKRIITSRDASINPCPFCHKHFKQYLNHYGICVEKDAIKDPHEVWTEVLCPMCNKMQKTKALFKRHFEEVHEGEHRATH